MIRDPADDDYQEQDDDELAEYEDFWGWCPIDGWLGFEEMIR